MGSDLTLEEVAEVLFEAVRPFYKGLPAPGETMPEFRKSLTGEEVANLLTSIHHAIAMIHMRNDDCTT